MNANVINEAGKSETMTMGCYGIGISRIVAAAVEQSHDDNGTRFNSLAFGIVSPSLFSVIVFGDKQRYYLMQCPDFYYRYARGTRQYYYPDRGHR
jgi:hypothetical protein